MKQVLSGSVGVWKRAVREKLFSLLGDDLMARQTIYANGTDLEEELGNQVMKLERSWEVTGRVVSGVLGE